MKAIPIHQAKANLSKYISEAKNGNPIYIGGYGEAEVVLMAIPKTSGLKIGAWKDRPLGYKDADIVGEDSEIIKDFNESVNKSC